MLCYLTVYLIEMFWFFCGVVVCQSSQTPHKPPPDSHEVKDVKLFARQRGSGALHRALVLGCVLALSGLSGCERADVERVLSFGAGPHTIELCGARLSVPGPGWSTFGGSWSRLEGDEAAAPRVRLDEMKPPGQVKARVTLVRAGGGVMQVMCGDEAHKNIPTLRGAKAGVFVGTIFELGDRAMFMPHVRAYREGACQRLSTFSFSAACVDGHEAVQWMGEDLCTREGVTHRYEYHYLVHKKTFWAIYARAPASQDRPDRASLISLNNMKLVNIISNGNLSLYGNTRSDNATIQALDTDAAEAQRLLDRGPSVCVEASRTPKPLQ